MKRVFTIILVFCLVNIFAQSPQGINYQSIIRNSAGTILPSTAVLVEFKLYNGLAGSLVYFEKHNTTTNSFGMANLIIGQGTPVTGTFNSINWVNGIAYEVYVNSNLVGTKQLFMSVPYALFSSTPPLNLSGSVLSSGPSTNSVTLNTGTTFTNGAGISISSGTIISNTSPNQTVTLVPGNSNVSIGGLYPNYSVSSTSTLSLAGTTLSISNGNTVVLPNPGASTTITPAAFPNNNVLITGAAPSYTIGAPSYSITNPVGNTLIINNSLNSSTLNFNPILSGDAIGPINSSTVISIQGEPISPINPSPGQVLQYIGSIWTPTTLSPPPSPTLNLTSNILSVGSSTINLANPINGLWSTNGNVGTNAATNYLGTTDPVDFNIRTNNINRMTIVGANGRVGIANALPVSELDVNGSLRLSGSRLFLGTVGGVNSGYTGIYENTSDLKFAVFNAGAPANPPFASGGNSKDAMIIKSTTGNVGIGINTPSNIFAIGNGVLEKFNMVSSNGSMNFLDDQASITFPATGAAPRPMIQMFASGTSNTARMVISHSAGFPNYGLQYDDVNDRFHFMGSGTPVLTTDLTSLRVGIGTTAPSAKLEVIGNVKITDGTQAVGKVLTSDAVGAGTWNYPLSPIKVGNYGSFLTIANSGANTYYTGANLLVITPTISGVVLLNFNGRYNFDISQASQISFGIYINTSGIAPTAATGLTAAVTVGWAIPPSGGGFGDIPVSFTHTLNVVAGTTYYVWVGAYDLNFNQAGASFGPVSLTATLHQASGL